MDDMKKLVERYKRELMEYSKAARPAPESKLEFPEMVQPESVPEAAEEMLQPESEVTDTASDYASTERAPQVIGYGSADIMEQFSNIFGESADDKYSELPENGEYSGVSTVTPDQAEELDDIPESGESPDEQLGKRDFEEQDNVQNDPADIQPLEQSGEAAVIPQEREYATLDEFVEVNNRRGTTRFRTFTARGAFPVAGATVVISHIIGGKKHVFYALTTDISGQTPIVTLPVPPKELSETPDSSVQPYATYDAEITAEGYNDVIITNMPVFEGVMSVQQVALVPSLSGMAEIIEESEPDLNGGA